VKDQSVPVSDTDELTVAGGRLADRARTFGEFKPTNTPLSAAEIARRMQLARTTHHLESWTPRTTENIGELTPIPDGETVEV
jgi:hypothetical protein